MNKITIEIEKSYHKVPVPLPVLHRAYTYLLEADEGEYRCQITECHDVGEYVLGFYHVSEYGHKPIIFVNAIPHEKGEYTFHS